MRWIIQHTINFIGASSRWLYGTIWRSISGKKNYSFKEYLWGPKDSDDWHDEEMVHTLNNRILGIIVLFLVIVIITYFGKLKYRL